MTKLTSHLGGEMLETIPWPIYRDAPAGDRQDNTYTPKKPPT